MYDQSGRTVYYTYNIDTHSFNSFTPSEEYFDPSVMSGIQVYTPYSIYKVNYFDSKLELDEGDLLPVTANNTPLLAGVQYKYFTDEVPYN